MLESGAIRLIDAACLRADGLPSFARRQQLELRNKPLLRMAKGGLRAVEAAAEDAEDGDENRCGKFKLKFCRLKIC